MDTPLPQKTRSSNFEWLRIISMLGIIASHLAGHAVYPEATSVFNQLVRFALMACGKLGVNCFVLISGYFLLRSRFSWRKVARLVATVWVYSVSIYLGFALSEGTFDIIDFGKAFFPLIYNQYWFMTAYMIAYILSPFLALLLNASSQAKHRALLITMFVLASVLGLFPEVELISSVGWFLFLMALGAYLSRYPRFFAQIKPWMALLACAVLWAVITAVYFLLHYNMFRMDHPVALAWALALFAVFANAKIPNCKLVNRLAAGTLGVYLFHDNNYVRPRIWNDWLRVGFHAESGTYILFAFVAIVGVWVVCTLADTLRQVVFAYAEKGLDVLWRKAHPVEIPIEPPDEA